jgi:hypothetical protein
MERTPGRQPRDHPTTTAVLVSARGTATALHPACWSGMLRADLPRQQLTATNAVSVVRLASSCPRAYEMGCKDTQPD